MESGLCYCVAMVGSTGFRQIGYEIHGQSEFNKYDESVILLESEN